MSEHDSSPVPVQDRDITCPPWCTGWDGTEDPQHDKFVAEGTGWTVHVRQTPGERAYIELSTSSSELMGVGDFSPAVARSIAAALVRAADIEEFELPVGAAAQG